MRFIALVFLLFLSNTGFSIKIEKLAETVLSEKYPNSNKTMVIVGSELLSVDERSLSVYKITENKFFRISSLNLEGTLHSVEVWNSYAFITTTPPVNRVYKIDITNIYNPSVVDTINIFGSYTGFVFQDKYCVNELFKNKKWAFRIFDVEDFKEISTIMVPHENWPLEKLNDMLLTLISNEFIEVYNLKENKLVLKTGQHITELSYPRKTLLHDDSIFIHSCMIGGLRIYDISYQYNWDLLSDIHLPISNFQIAASRLIVVVGGHQIWQFDISEIKKPLLMDSLTLDEKIRDIALYGDHIYTTCMEGKLYNLQIDENKITIQSEYSQYGYIRDAIYNDNNVILNTALGFLVQIQMINDEITIVNAKKESVIPGYLRNYENTFINYGSLKSSDASLTAIGKIRREGIDFLEKRLYNFPDNVAVFNNNLIYLNQGYIRVYKISDELSLRTEIKFIEFKAGRFFFNNGLIYLIGLEKGIILKFNETNSSLKIVGNFDVYSNSYSQVAFYKNFMIISPEQEFGTSDVYDISDLNHIIEVGIIPFSGKLTLDEKNAILFIGRIDCKLYDLSNILKGSIKYLTEIKNDSTIVKLFHTQNENKNCLWLINETSVSLYSYE